MKFTAKSCCIDIDWRVASDPAPLISIVSISTDIATIDVWLYLTLYVICLSALVQVNVDWSHVVCWLFSSSRLDSVTPLELVNLSIRIGKRPLLLFTCVWDGAIPRIAEPLVFSTRTFEMYLAVLNWLSQSRARSFVCLMHVWASLFPNETVFNPKQFPLSSADGKTRYPPKAFVSTFDEAWTWW